MAFLIILMVSFLAVENEGPRLHTGKCRRGDQMMVIEEILG